jgi:hypothetical protein
MAGNRVLLRGFAPDLYDRSLWIFGRLHNALDFLLPRNPVPLGQDSVAVAEKGSNQRIADAVDRASYFADLHFCGKLLFRFASFPLKSSCLRLIAKSGYRFA